MGYIVRSFIATTPWAQIKASNNTTLSLFCKDHFWQEVTVSVFIGIKFMVL